MLLDFERQKLGQERAGRLPDQGAFDHPVLVLSHGEFNGDVSILIVSHIHGLTPSHFIPNSAPCNSLPHSGDKASAKSIRNGLSGGQSIYLSAHLIAIPTPMHCLCLKMAPK